MALALHARQLPILRSVLWQTGHLRQWSASAGGGKPEASGVVVGAAQGSESLQPTNAPPASSGLAGQADQEWTEVVHSSGQVYWWNQKTGDQSGACGLARFVGCACMHAKA